jgi:hypothetical protein
MKRGFTPAEVLSMKKDVLPFSGAWAEAFGQPERTGVWFVWGNSGNGKTSFVMQLCKELTRFGKVAYDSLEEGSSLTMANTLRRFNMQEANRRFLLLDCEPMDELAARMAKRKSPDFVVIDSYQYSGLSYKEYKEFKEANRNKLIIFVSHADGNRPSGRSAKSVMYDATLKVWVEGYEAVSKGRFIGPNGGRFVVWDEGKARYGFSELRS